MISNLKKNLTWSLVFCASVTAIYFQTRKTLDGFTERNIHYPLSNTKAPLPDTLKHLHDLDFFYLGRGNQFYAFVSSDLNYVIKFIRFDHLTPKLPIRFLSMFIPNHPYVKSRLDRAALSFKSLFASVDCAKTYMPDITGLIHLQMQPLDKPMRCFDTIKVLHLIQNAPFVVQSYCPKLESVIEAMNNQELETLVDEIVSLQKRRFDLGIEDGDPKITTKHLPNYSWQRYQLLLSQ